jgi:cell division protein ZapA
MAEVALSVGGRVYPIACRDGEEAHLQALAARVDAKTGEAKAAVGDTGEARLLLLSALLLADELIETKSAASATSPTIPHCANWQKGWKHWPIALRSRPV